MAEEKINAKSLFNDFNTDISTVSRVTGLGRGTVYRMVEFRTYEKNANAIIGFLEEMNAQSYNNEINECIKEMKQIIFRIKDAWTQYERKEMILKNYRRKYGLIRAQPLATRVMTKEVLKKAIKP